MKTQRYLMSFERMVQLLRDRGVKVDASQIMGLQATPSHLLCNGRIVVFADDLFEKLGGTWWEVELSCQGERPSQCMYLADSLQDAMRLRPEINTSYWGSLDETVSDFLADVNEWAEDECFVD